MLGAVGARNTYVFVIF